jgi:ubiquinone/menaquinone biosynthesis C-methylase UbiE
VTAKKPRFTVVRLSKDEVRRIYARLSRIYDFWGVITESKAVDRALALADMKNGETVLEVAVGTGKVFEHIVSMNPDGRSEGIDLSPEMLAVAERRLKKYRSRYSVKVADAYSLPFADETFDLIVNNYMFDLLPEEDFPVVLGEFKRVLKSGGRMAVTSMTPGKQWYSRIWDRLVHAAPNILMGCRPISLEDDTRQAGFKDIHTEYVSQLTFPSLVLLARKP